MECESPEDLCDVATEVLCLILFWGGEGMDEMLWV